MKLLYYKFMLRLCWLMEDIYNCFFGADDFSDELYLSEKWEDLVYDEEGNENG